MKKTFLFLALGVIFSISSKAQTPNYLPTSGLQGWWPFCGNANDQSGNMFNGTVTGASLTPDRFGNLNSAYGFNGTSDYISTNMTGILGSNPRAVSLWAKTTNSTSTMCGVSWGNEQSVPNAGVRYECAFNYANTGATIIGSDCAITYSTSSNVNDNNWHHYVYQYNGGQLNQVQVYQDGVLLSQILSTHNPNTVLNTSSIWKVNFGRIPYSIAHYFSGQLDDIAIWDRTLTIPEILGLYNGSSSCDITTAINKLNSNSSYFNILPNPANQNLIIKCNSQYFNDKEMRLSIYSNDGMLVKNETISVTSNQIEQLVNIENLTCGFYYINISDGKNSQNLKFIKE